MAQRFPMSPFPSGWFAVELSDHLEVGEVKPLRYFDHELVLFRGEDGTARMLDAYCPHLGTHLGYGGRVEGQTLRCPFHGWRFDGSGACVEIPYSEKIPEVAARGSRAWAIREYAGMILAYWHHDGLSADWEVPRLLPFGEEGWTETLWRQWRVRSHPQEVLENGVDCQHFHYLHDMPPAPEHVEAVSNGPILEVHNRFPRGRVDVTIVAMGLSLARNEQTGVESWVVTAATPIDGDEIDVRVGLAVKELEAPGATEGAVQGLRDAVFGNVDQDAVIWGHKRCHLQPTLVKSEQGIHSYRRWARQFYPEQEPDPRS